MTQTRLPAGVAMPGTPASCGSCYGYRVSSRLDFRFLRDEHGGAECLQVVEGDRPVPADDQPLLAWDRFGGLPIAGRLHEAAGRFALWVENMGTYHIDPFRRLVEVPIGVDEVRREERLWGIPAALVCMTRGDLPVHASAVDIGGSAVLLAAPGHYGKTTLAGAFMRAGYRVLSEDTTCVTAAARPVAHPGPAMLRVRRDVYEQLEYPGTDVVAEEPERVHLALTEPLRGDGRPLPVAAVILLRHGVRGCRMERVDPQVALRDVFALTFKLPLAWSRTSTFGGAAHLTSEVPVWNLHRPLRFDNLTEIVDRVMSTCGPRA